MSLFVAKRFTND